MQSSHEKNQQKIDFGTLLLIAKQQKNLDGFSLDGVDFSNHNLPMVSFRRVKADLISFENTEIPGANFENADLSSCNFDKVQALGAKFIAAKIGILTAKGAILTNSIFEDMVIRSANFSGANLVGCTFRRVQFYNCIFDDADFKRAKLDGVFVSSCRFINADFTGVSLSSVSWHKHENINPFTQAKTTGEVGLPDPVLMKARNARLKFEQALQAGRVNLSHMGKYELGQFVPNGVSESLSEYREALGLSHKSIFQNIGMPERTYFHKSSAAGNFTAGEVLEIFSYLKKQEVILIEADKDKNDPLGAMQRKAVDKFSLLKKPF